MNACMSSELSDEARQVNKKIQYGMIDTGIELYKGEREEGNERLLGIYSVMGTVVTFHYITQEEEKQLPSMGASEKASRRRGCNALTLNRQGG